MSSPPNENPPAEQEQTGQFETNTEQQQYSSGGGISKAQNGGPALRQAALAYAARGWRIIPLHNVRVDGSCSCGDPNCESVGKHPRTLHGQNDATVDAAMINKWWGKWPDANVGLHCQRSGVAVIDIDPRNGGDITFAALEIAHGEIVSPLTSNTGGGGKHLIFDAPDVSLPGTLGSGIELKHNGYVVLPPSNHKSGKLYQWENATLAMPPPLPAWVMALDRATIKAQMATMIEPSTDTVAYTLARLDRDRSCQAQK